MIFEGNAGASVGQGGTGGSGDENTKNAGKRYFVPRPWGSFLSGIVSDLQMFIIYK